MSQAGILDIENSNPQIPTKFIEDVGFAIPIANELNILGNGGITTSGAGNTVTIDGSGIGAATDFIVDSFTAPGTNPVLSNGSGEITLTGAQVATGTIGTNVIRTDSLAASSITIEVQRTTSVAASDITKNGVAHFDSSGFTVDANGFVSLIASGAAIEKVYLDTGTTPIVPTAGAITLHGATVVAGSNPIRTDGTGISTATIEVQISQALAALDATKIGLSNFDSTSFAVDASGFVQSKGGGFTWNDVSGAFSPLKNNGYFITGTATGTLPASPSQGDTIKFFVDHASQVLTIDAPGTQIIRMGSAVTAAGGTAVSTAQGDSVELTYRASDTCWCGIAGFSGIWVLT